MHTTLIRLATDSLPRCPRCGEPLEGKVVEVYGGYVYCAPCLRTACYADHAYIVAVSRSPEHVRRFCTRAGLHLYAPGPGTPHPSVPAVELPLPVGIGLPSDLEDWLDRATRSIMRQQEARDDGYAKGI